MKKKIMALLLSMIMAAMLTACGKGEHDKKEHPNCKGEVAIFWFTFDNTYLSTVRQATCDAFKAAGIKHHDYDANGSQTTQTEQIQIALIKGASVICVNLVDANSDDATEMIINMAKAAKKPVIFFNRSVSKEVVETYDKAAFIGTDYTMAGHMQGEMIGKYLVANYDKLDLNKDGKISYVLLKGQEGNMEADARTKYSVEDANAILKKAGKPELVFYDSHNPSKYLVDMNGSWSAAQGQEYMQTILTHYSESNNNMVELVIANNDDMALGALAALENGGYNIKGKKYIPVFGVDATEAAKAKIDEKAMVGTVKQDAEGMAKTIFKMAENMTNNKPKFDSIDPKQIDGDWRIIIPYTTYTGN